MVTFPTDFMFQAIKSSPSTGVIEGGWGGGGVTGEPIFTA